MVDPDLDLGSKEVLPGFPQQHTVIRVSPYS